MKTTITSDMIDAKYATREAGKFADHVAAICALVRGANLAINYMAFAASATIPLDSLDEECKGAVAGVIIASYAIGLIDGAEIAEAERGATGGAIQ